MQCDRGVVAEVVPKATVEERRCGADSERLQPKFASHFLSHVFVGLSIYTTLVFALGICVCVR